MRHCIPVVTGAALSVLVLGSSSPVVAAAALAELCAAESGPCVVSQPVVASGTLDLGVRALRVEGAGRIDLAAGDAEVACGRLELRTSGAAVRVAGGSALSVLVRRACSLAPRVACLTDADCAPLAAGTCSAGDGTATLDGAVVADGEFAGSIALRSAGDVVVQAAVLARGTRADADGGAVEIESTTGSVVIEAAIDVSGGGAASGGGIDLLAAGDVVVRAPIRATGGEYDGGQVWLSAGRDVLVLDDVSAAAAAGAGFGGAVVVESTRDAVFDGGSATNEVVIDVDGHQSAENYGGDGGTIEVEAGRDLVVTRHARFAASGAAPDGFADTLSFAADGELSFDAAVVAKGRGSEGGGAIVDLVSGGGINVSSAASFDLAGAAIGGDLTLESDGALSFAGSADVSSSSSGVAGRILAIAAADAIVSGRWTTSGGSSSFSVGELYLEACGANVTGALSNAAASGRTTIVARESIEVGAGGAIVASGAGASNTLRCRTVDAAPLVAGVVRPEASLVVDETLEPCHACASWPDGCPEAALCTELCSGASCRTGEMISASLVLRAGRERTGGTWKGEIVSPGLALGDAEVRVVAAGASSGPLLDERLAAGAFRSVGASWRMQRDHAPAPLRKVVFRPGSSDGLLRVRIQFDLAADAFLDDGGVALALVIGDPDQGGEPQGRAPCADSGPLACERSRRRTLCTAAR